MSSLLRRRKNHHHHHVAQPDTLISRSGSLRPPETLSPLKEGPDDTDGGDSRMEGRWGHWMKGQLCRAPSVSCSAYKRSDLRLLLGVLGAPLAPVHVSATEPLPHLSIKDTPIVSSSFPLTLVHFFLFLIIIIFFTLFAKFTLINFPNYFLKKFKCSNFGLILIVLSFAWRAIYLFSYVVIYGYF